MSEIRGADAVDTFIAMIPELEPEAVFMRELGRSGGVEYVVLGSLFNRVEDVWKGRSTDPSTKREFLARVYDAVEEMLIRGDSSTNDAFVIEFVHPICGDPKQLGGLREFLGPRSLEALIVAENWRPTD
jgi:hypothetical protein